jgi:1-acyl-sn-glycerol-3-phosphate acyltransferase
VTSVPHISTPVLRFFRRIVRGYFRRHFRAVRVSEAARWDGLPEGPVIVYANHSSWWDPMVSVLLAERFMPERKHYAPMDAAALERYGILKRVGVFGVEQHSARGAAQFLRTGIEILKEGGVIWITPQGRFADVRERPVEFKPGLAALVARAPVGYVVLPMAVEYTFWDERLPEVLLHFGEPIEGNGSTGMEDKLEAGLVEVMEQLRVKVEARDPAGFAVIATGRVGVGGFYQTGQRLLARLRGRKYQAEHTAGRE